MSFERTPPYAKSLQRMGLKTPKTDAALGIGLLHTVQHKALASLYPRQYKIGSLKLARDSYLSLIPPLRKFPIDEVLRNIGIPSSSNCVAEIGRDSDRDILYVKFERPLKIGKAVIHIEGARQLIFDRKTNSLSIFNNGLLLSTDDPINPLGHGIGTVILANQVIGARELGVRYLSLNAERKKDNNGHYTWLRLGYVPHQRDSYLNLGIDSCPNLVKHNVFFPNLPEVIDTQIGRYWVRKFGGPFFDMRFDTAPDSESTRRLRDYMVERALLSFAPTL